MIHSKSIKIGDAVVALDRPTYFIADIGANHDGDLDRAKQLIHLCADAGANAAKFQHFLADQIVSDYGFRHLGGKLTHQAGWSGSVFDVYRRYELNRDWTDELASTAAQAGVAFMTTPYDLGALKLLDDVVPAYKIGSGDITWIDFIEQVSRRGRPVLLATGASPMEDVERAVDAVTRHTTDIVLMQCNTNYTGGLENFAYVNLRVLTAFERRWPGIVLGLSDHTPGHSAVLGAVTLGARVVEKHFTDDPTREGPDHLFSLTATSWREMVDRVHELEHALGDGVKRVEVNERETAVVQRRCLRFTLDIAAGEVLRREHLRSLRPAPEGSAPPYRLGEFVGREVVCDKRAGDALYDKDVN